MRLTTPLTAMALASLAWSSAAWAGSFPAGQANISVQIADDAGYNWSLNLSPFASYNASTGDFGLDLGAVQSPVSDATGQWSTGTTRVYDTATDTFVNVAGISWHSWATVNGSMGSGAADPTNPWRSVVTFAAKGNIDPDMSYGFFAKNNSNATQSYTVSYGETMAPAINGAYTLHADISGSVTNPAGTGSVSVSPLVGATKLQSTRLSSDGGLTFVNGGVNVGNAYASSLVGSQAYGGDSADTAGIGHYNYWDFKTQFLLSSKDTAALTGYAEISAVPEPASWLLPVLGLAGMGVMRRIRAQA